MIVVDASAVVDALVGSPSSPELAARLSRAHSLHVPHLVDSEVQAALRGLVIGGKLSARRAKDALDDFDDLLLFRYPAQPLASQIWKLRGSLTTYDATYVALATQLGCPLVTCDQRLGRSMRTGSVEVF